jgi:hypothetical protein
MSKFFIAFYMATIPVHFESRYAQVSLQAKEVKQHSLFVEGTLHNFGASTHYDGQLYGERNSKCFQIFLRMSKFKS